MKIEEHFIPSVSIETFAEQHDLTMVVKEREKDLITKLDLFRYYAYFKGAEVKYGTGFLSSTFGEGSTPAAAITNYAEEINGKVLVFNAMSPDRLEIKVPNVT